jgi:hypothetical protein
MRKEERKPVSRPARLELGEGKVVPCRIADLSSGGALLMVSDSEWLPKTFILYDTFSDTRRQVQLMWTSPNRAGVRYLDRNPVAPAGRKPTGGFGKRGS